MKHETDKIMYSQNCERYVKMPSYLCFYYATLIEIAYIQRWCCVYMLLIKWKVLSKAFNHLS